MPAGELPGLFAGGGPGGVDGLQGSRRVAGQGRDRPGHRRVRRNPTIDARLGTQQGEVGQTVPAQSEAERTRTPLRRDDG